MRDFKDYGSERRRRWVWPVLVVVAGAVGYWLGGAPPEVDVVALEARVVELEQAQSGGMPEALYWANVAGQEGARVELCEEALRVQLSNLRLGLVDE